MAAQFGPLVSRRRKNTHTWKLKIFSAVRSSFLVYLVKPNLLETCTFCRPANLALARLVKGDGEAGGRYWEAPFWCAKVVSLRKSLQTTGETQGFLIVVYKHLAKTANFGIQTIGEIHDQLIIDCYSCVSHLISNKIIVAQYIYFKMFWVWSTLDVLGGEERLLLIRSLFPRFHQNSRCFFEPKQRRTPTLPSSDSTSVLAKKNCALMASQCCLTASATDKNAQHDLTTSNFPTTQSPSLLARTTKTSQRRRCGRRKFL